MYSDFGVQKNQTSALSLRSSNSDSAVEIEVNMEKEKFLQKKGELELPRILWEGRDSNHV